MLPEKIAFVDIETTGGSAFYDRIIEIGILRVENNKLVKTYHSLINPQAHLPKEIELLTGITPTDLESAPTFRTVKDEIQEILSDCYFVAHNVRFDYGFLKSEFKRENITFSTKHFCTVRLSRLLYPRFKHHNLDAIIERHNFTCANRHRALDDAKVLFDFYQKLQLDFTEQTLAETISKSIKKPSTPLKLPYSVLENLPELPGIYIFYSESGMPLYVGKSVNIKDRVLSHFCSDIRSNTEMNISQQVTSIETVPTSGELGALLLESITIKKLLPLYNKISRVKQELLALKSRTDTQGYSTAYLEPIQSIDIHQIGNGSDGQDSFLGFFRSRKQAKAYLADLARKYSLCDKLLGLEKTKKDCFSYRLEQCNGACLRLEKPAAYNLRFIEAFSQIAILPWPFSGPVSIEERGFHGNIDYFLVDRWCYLGRIAIDEYGEKKEDLMHNSTFDLDDYKILRRYIKNPKNHGRIRPVNLNEYRGLFMNFRSQESIQ